jgi:hypothetical protein
MRRRFTSEPQRQRGENTSRLMREEKCARAKMKELKISIQYRLRESVFFPPCLCVSVVRDLLRFACR